MGRFVNPFTDEGFKIIFGQEISKPLLLDFLNTLLEGVDHIVDLSFSDKEQVTDYEDDRLLIYDVLCTTSDGKKVIVEMQNKKQGFFKKRSIYYVSRAISRQGEKGDQWRYDIKAVYFIAFMNFQLPDMPDFRTDVVLMDVQRKNVFSTDVRMTFLQLPLFTKEQEECETNFEKWIFIFKNMNVLDRMPWSAQNAVFKRLGELAEVAHLGTVERDRYESALKHYRDTLDVFETAKEDGYAEGRAEGLEAGRAEGRTEGKKAQALETARKMKLRGYSIDIISDITALTPDEISKLEQKKFCNFKTTRYLCTVNK